MRPTRPPGPAPLVCELLLSGVTPIRLSFNREAEPVAVGRIAQLVEARAYDGATLQLTPYWLALHFGADVEIAPPKERIELRRVVHSKFIAGSIGWSWEKVAVDGRGEWFITLERVDGLDSPYQVVGEVTAGLEALLALKPPPSPKLVRKHPAPITIQSIRTI